MERRSPRKSGLERGPGEQQRRFALRLRYVCIILHDFQGPQQARVIAPAGKKAHAPVAIGTRASPTGSPRQRAHIVLREAAQGQLCPNPVLIRTPAKRVHDSDCLLPRDVLSTAEPDRVGTGHMHGHVGGTWLGMYLRVRNLPVE